MTKGGTLRLSEASPIAPEQQASQSRTGLAPKRISFPAPPAARSPAPRPPRITRRGDDALLAELAANGRPGLDPADSAQRLFTPGQLCVLLAAGLGLILCAVPAPHAFVTYSGSFLGFLCLASVALRYGMLSRFLFTSPAAACAPLPQTPLETHNLPVYTILAPLLGETAVVDKLIDNLRALDYPADKLDIKLVLEAHDAGLIAHVEKLPLEPHFEVVITPSRPPLTKAKACNYALFFVRGELLTIYDAEDQPHPQQLRRAANAFSQAPEELVCLQAPLNFFRSKSDNWLARQFAIEYTTHFSLFLPLCVLLGVPVLLGGTSNHFRTDALIRLGGWDAYNLTEDAELGLRIARAGLRCAMLDSLTLEEPNGHLQNWLRQRSRWIKGWLQTWLAAMRRPRRLRQAIGLRGVLWLHCMIPAYIISLLAHCTLWPAIIVLSLAGVISWKPAALALGGIGYAAAIFFSFLACHISQAGKRDLAPHAVFIPLFWLLMGAAALRALWQLCRRPHHWDKTPHGLSQPDNAA